MAQYQYRPLSGARSFRVLKLTRPSHDLELSSLHGDLVEVHLDHVPAYDAISYTWGDPAPVVPIVCGGRHMRVTNSCAEALRRFMRGKFDRTVWVDGICIDQQSIQERNQQVRVMGEIYAKADKILIWLGPGTPASDLAMNWAKDLTMAFVTGRFQQKVAELHAFEIENMETYPFGLLGEIFRRPWFKRMWVIQEVAMAQASSVMFYCGDRMIHLINLFTAVDYSKIDTALPSQKHWHSYPALLRLLKDAVDRKIKHEPLDSWLTLSFVLSMASYKVATDAKDKVFALYGIAQCLDWQMPTPDYGQPTSKVYIDTTRTVIESEQSLRVLDLAAGTKSFPGLPSWVPDYSQLPNTAFPPFTWFNAGRDSNLSYCRSKNPNELIVRGIFLDLIDTCGGPMTLDMEQTVYRDRLPPPERTEQMLHVLQAWLFLARELPLPSTPAQHNPSVSPPPHTTDNLFARTVFMDTLNDRDPTGVTSLYHATLAPVLQQPIPESSPAARAFFSSTPFQHGFQHAMKSVIGRAFATTHGGRMANVPCAARALDVLVLFAGARVPSVIRQGEDGRVGFVGSAYVHGVMDGEAWVADRREWQEWVLV